MGELNQGNVNLEDDTIHASGSQSPSSMQIPLFRSTRDKDQTHQTILPLSITEYRQPVPSEASTTLNSLDCSYPPIFNPYGPTKNTLNRLLSPSSDLVAEPNLSIFKQIIHQIKQSVALLIAKNLAQTFHYLYDYRAEHA